MRETLWRQLLRTMSSERQRLNGWMECVGVVLLCEFVPPNLALDAMLMTKRKRIYFDGFLPPAKLNTRLKRLESQTRQSIDYYNAHPIPCRAPSKNQTTSISIFTSQSPRPALTSLPAPPFLVPAILEALIKSEYYKIITEVVPGEADLYCARYLKKHGGTVFTGDSDLLVHELGMNGAVAFFKDIEDPNTSSGSLQSRIYHSAAIAERLGLPKSPGLLSLAFEMFMDNHGTFPKLVAQASTLKAIKTHEKMYQNFCKEYASLDGGVEETSDITPVLSVLRSLDPRISEVVLQFPAIGTLARQETAAATQNTPHVFLPFLLDCPIRTSTWEMSTSVRQLAYGLINLIVPESQQRFSIYEHRRQQKNSSGREWQLPSISEIPDACTAVANLLKLLRDKLPKTSEVDLWLAIAIYQDIERASSLDKTPLSRAITDQLFDLQDPRRYYKNCSWDVIHLLAQIQGSYYSFRILKQIINLLIAHNGSRLLPEPVRQLNNHLESLPGFCDILDLSHVTSIYQRIQSNNILKMAHEIVGIEEPEAIGYVETSVSSSSKKKQKRKGASVTTESSALKKKSTNPFELLGQE